MKTLTIFVAMHFVLANAFHNVSQAAPNSDRQREFQATIWPILDSKCVACHNEEVREGGLSLASLDSLLVGGDHGVVIDEDHPEDSKLIRMLTDDNVRMPLDGSPLSDAEVDALKSWVRGGAIYESVSADNTRGAFTTDRFHGAVKSFWSVAKTPIASPYGISRWIPMWPVSLGVPCLILCLVSLQKIRLILSPTIPVISLSVGCSTLLLLNAFLFANHYQQCLDPSTLRGAQHQVHMMFGNPPLPRRMDQDFALARTYYRGNDERDSKMFNNGNYLTCTFHLKMVDTEGEELRAGSTIAPNSKIFLNLQIERAPYTADGMFCQQVMEQIFLTAEPEIDRCFFATDRASLRETRPAQQWDSTIALLENVSDGRHEKTIYVWQGQHNTLLEKLSKMHYAAHLKLDLKDGVIQPTSNLWFNAMRYTQPFVSLELSPDEWLSNSPIPELPGTNTDSPPLIGLK